MLFRFLLAASILFLASHSAHSQINIVANYTDSAGEGFFDSTLGSQRRNAFEFALNRWGSFFTESYAGETITIDAAFDNLGGTSTSATLGQAGSTGGGFVPGGDPLGANIFRNAPVLNHIAGADVFGGSEMQAQFNSDVDGSFVLGPLTWYYGTDGNAPVGTIDFVQTAMHEIAHGLGFAGTLRPVLANGNLASQTQLNAGQGVGANYINGTFINSFDHHVVRKSDGMSLTSLSEADRYAAVLGDDIAWNGANGLAANGGNMIDLEGTYSSAFGTIPAGTWILGSTYSHLDEDDFASDLMSPLANGGIGFDPSALDLGILADVGWTLAPVPEPGSALVLIGFGIVIIGRRRKLAV